MLADIRSQSAEELEAQFRAWGQPAYRVGQLLEWLYVHRATSWEAMTNRPRALRDELRNHYSLMPWCSCVNRGAGHDAEVSLAPG